MNYLKATYWHPKSMCILSGSLCYQQLDESILSNFTGTSNFTIFLSVTRFFFFPISVCVLVEMKCIMFRFRINFFENLFC